MKHDSKVRWLLDCEPRPAQLEALYRSYDGVATRDRRDQEPDPQPLKHFGRPAEGWGHFLEMRVGKTPTLLNEWLMFEQDYGLKKALVFTPNRYKTRWALEANRFGVVAPVHVFDSSMNQAKYKKAEYDKFVKGGEGILFVNYEALASKKNCAALEEWVDDRTFMGADESVIIKNRNSGFFKASHELSKSAAVTRPMTGKPAPQGVQDMYAQLRFARKFEGWNYYQFRHKFAVMGGFKGKQIIGIKNEDLLQKMARDCYFFARRVDWGTALPNDHETVELEMLPAQAKAYDDMERDFMTWLNEDEFVTADQVITKHIKLQQISSGFIIDEFQDVHQVVPFDQTPKFQELKNRLENSIPGKTLVICHFNHTANLLAEHLAQFEPAMIRGTAAMRKAGREVEAEKERFNNDPKCRVLLGQSKAIKYGHTLMGTPDDPCITTVYYENSYSLDDRSQSEQRNQGEGQVSPIHVMDFYSSEVERRVVEALQRKEIVSGVIMGYYKQAA